MSDFPFGDEPDDLDYWRLCDELNIYEATLLTLGFSPGKLKDVERWDWNNRPRGYEPTKTAIRNALRGGRIRGTIELESDFIKGEEQPILGSVSVSIGNFC